MKWGSLLLLLMLAWPALAIESYDFSTADGERRYNQMVRELRCPTCQNQAISDSDAPLAADLRREVHRMIEEGYSDDYILEFMVNRYGDFVHYRPPFTSQTWILWFGPLVLLVLGALAVLRIARNRHITPVEVKAQQQELPSALSPQEQARLQALLKSAPQETQQETKS
ncbi:cytochrome c-type biogenesis protein [Nitrincola tapanii]|uniref:Cytochrome c-type biogenesis protein n=1 Tax=Nitrincola tapanii TaxID=1708751 RepID=A0A5A9W3J6_9GAMM|nr:cytochrome c-type biogenesis protein [Nitrincola tapanii]KAA0874769.1 cytochrome c-type biogenesis protein CcmH [Nitrincola tapanii]